MNKPAAVASLLFLVIGDAAAQQLKLSGVALDEAAYHAINQRSLYNPKNALLDLYDRSNLMTLELNADADFSSTMALRSSVQGTLKSERQTERDALLRELYFSLSLISDLEIVAGRRILKWGTGYAYNPSGVVEPHRDPADPTDRLRRYRGLDLLQVDWFRGASALTLVYLNTLDTGGQWHFAGDHRLAARLSTLWRGFDVALIGFWERTRHAKMGANFTKVFGDALEIHGEFLGQQGRDELVHLISQVASPDTIFRSYPFASGRDASEFFAKFLVGFQYTFRNDYNLAMEYYHNGQGMESGDWQRFLNYLSFANSQLDDPRWIGSQGNLAAANLLWSTGALSPTGSTRDYGFARLYAPRIASDRLSADIIAVMNLQDCSMVLIPSSSFYLGRQVSAYLRWSGYVGRRQSEFGGLLEKYSIHLGLSFKFFAGR